MKTTSKNRMLFKKVIITGGGGYVGSALAPLLIERGYDVTVIDLFLYGKKVFDPLKHSSRLHLIQGDIRDTQLLYTHFRHKDALIHLACISNDPSFDLNPELGKSINFGAFPGIMGAIGESSIKRFIYASSSSVYGIRNEQKVVETTPCMPLTDYSKYKLRCERTLQNEELRNCDYIIVRPATVCGYAPRLRLDLTVNLLTINALALNQMTVFGGEQLRPHICIQDMADVYCLLLEADASKIKSQVFNAGYENRSVLSTANLIKKHLEQQNRNTITLEIQQANDPRSYHIDSGKINKILGFKPRHTLKDAVDSLLKAYQDRVIQNPLENSHYYNIKRMKEINLQ